MNPLLLDPRIAALSPEKRALVLRRLGIPDPTAGARTSIIPRVDGSGPFPLSFAQRRLWILSELEGPAATYNIAAAVALTGPLNRFALEHSLAALGRRHDALRAILVRGADGGVTQRIASPDGVTIALDIERVAPADLAARASARARVPFDLERGPLARAVLFETGVDRHALLLVVHHLVADGWSMGILVRELAALYRGLATATPATLPELPTRYVDYAAWESASLDETALAPSVAFWREALRDAPDTLDVPVDRARLSQGIAPGATVRVEIDGAVVRGLRQVCEQEAASVVAGALATLSVLLSRYTGQQDVVIGCPFANRRHPETMGIVGYFVNTLPIRMRLDDAPTFRETVRRAKRGIVEALEHQALPFERLVDELHPDRASGRAPIYQVVLAYQTDEARALDLPGIAVAPVAVETGTAKFELTFLLEEVASTWRMAIEFRADLFDESTVQRMAEHWRRLMAVASAQPDASVDDLDLLSPHERQVIVGDWSGASTDTSIDRTVPEVFAAVAEARAEGVAVAWAGGTLQYGELARRASAIAASLQARGVGRGALVGVRASRSPEMVAALLGILQAGAGYVPVDPRDPPARQAFVVRATGVPLVLTDEAAGGGLAGVPIVPVRACWDGTARPAPVAITAGDAAYVMYTSGSTGTPKGVRIPHRGIVRLVCAPNYATLGPDETLLQYAPIGFDAATFEIWGALLNGARLVLAPASPTLAELGATIRDAGVTTLWLTASVFHLLVEEQSDALRDVRQLLAGGDVLSPTHVARATAAMRRGRVINGYGPTENTTFTCCHTVTSADRGAVPIGRPVRHTTVFVLDARGRPVPVGIAGELYTGGAGLAIDYVGQPAWTAERFVPHPFGSGRLYRTGDRVRWRADGTLDFLGRRDSQIKIRGFRVEPGEVEARLLGCAGVKRAVVVARDGVRSRELVAYVVPADPAGDAGALITALMADLRASLPDHMVPAGIVLLPDLPLSANGKVNRRALPALVRPAGSLADAKPATETERRVAAIFQELLGAADVGVGGHFFDLGGNSLVATQLASRIRRDLRIDLPLRQIFDTPDVAGLARACDAVAASARTAGDVIPAVDRGQTLPLSFAQERLWFLHRLEPDNPFYNVAIALEIHGDLDTALLERALQAIVARHDVLRTTYGEADGRPIQIVHDDLPFPLARIDLRANSGRRAEVERLAREEARRPFDLAAGPVARAVLVALEDAEHVLLLTLHHIASDGWSLGVLVRELMALYRGDTLAPLPLQYADFAAWQRRRMDGDDLAAQTTYWTREFWRLPGELVLPSDRPRPPVQSFRGGSIRFDVDRDVVSRIHALGREMDATLFMTLLAAFAAVLARHAGQEDLVVGSPIAGRTRTDLESLIGFFVNTLALRVDVSGAPTFRDLVARVRTVALHAYANQDLPFERLVDLVQPVRDLSRNPLFQVMFALQNAPVPALDLPGLRAVPMDVGRTSAQFDVVVDMWEVAHGLTGVLEFSADLFDAETAERMVGHFKTLLAGAAANPDRRVADLPLLTDLERHRLLQHSAGESAGFPIDRTLPALFEEQASIGPDRIAVECGAARWTYADLNARANRIAHRLRRMGVARHEFVGILLDRSELMSAAILGVLKAGAAYVPIDTTYPAGRVAHMLADSGVRAVLARAATIASAADHGWPSVEWLAIDDALESESTANPAPINAPADRAYMIYTSGSTGLPKGAIIRHDGTINHIYAQFRALAFHRDSAFLQTAPISSDISVWQYLAPLLIGGRTVIATHDVVCDAAALWTLMHSSRVTIAELVPVALAALLDHIGTLPLRERRLDQLEWMMATGEGVPPSLVNRWLEGVPGIPIVNAYGPTEAADDITQDVLRQPLPDDARTVSIGRPLSNLSVYVLDPALNMMPVGVPGEICVAGVGVGDGYWRDEPRTRDRFVPNPYRSGDVDAVLYRTGDLGVWRRDGRLDCLSRVDEQVKIRGFRIELGEVAAALATHPAVAQAVVIAREDPPGSEKSLVAYVVPDRSVPEVDVEVRQLRADQIALWKDLHDDEYRQHLDGGDPTFDVVGWDSTYTGAPLPIEDMREYVNGTVDRVLEAQPRRLLEIGCGTGLIMFRLLPHLDAYTGIDFSKTAIDRLRELQQAADGPKVPGFDRAVLLHGPATDLSAVAPGSIDTVVFPSVVQYFPGVDYLRDVIDRVMSVLTPDGTMVFADVRSLPLLEVFHASVAAHRAGESATAGAVMQRMVELAHGEQELAIDPAFFFALRADPRLRDVVVEPKRGRRQNEMTRFRYDVTIRMGTGAPRRTPRPWTASEGLVTIERLRTRLQAETGEAFCVAQLPNARVAGHAARHRALTAARPDHVAGEIGHAVQEVSVPGIEPEDLRALGAELGFDVYLSLGRSGGEGRLDAAFVRRGGALPELPAPDTSQPWLTYANNPLHERLAGALTPRLREYLKQRIPQYMVPPVFVMLGRLPLTPAGKIDRVALPAPRRGGAAAAAVPPRDPIETALVRIWSDVLGLETCGVTQNFFEIGGHSLKATQVVRRVRLRLGVDLPLRSVFAHPTIEEFAGLVRAAVPEAPATSSAAIVRTPDADDYPLSHAQRRLWLLSQFGDASVAYNMPASVLIEGPLDREALERALDGVIARHEALRTTFVASAGEPRQRVQASLPGVLSFVDLAGASDADDRVRRLAARDAAAPFDLEHGPLVRASLIRIAPERHVFLFNTHHIVSDEWSWGVIMREVTAAYGGAPLPDLRRQYRDYASWHRGFLESEAAASDRAWWLERLSGELPALDFPADAPRPPVKTYRGDEVLFRLGESETRALRELAIAGGASVFMALVAAVKVLLYRYTGQRDLIIVTPIAGRDHPDLEDQIGCYVNTLPLRDVLDPSASFAAFLGEVARNTTAVLDHQRYPFDRLVDELALRRDPSRMPISDVVVVIQNTDTPDFTLPGLAIRPNHAPGVVSKYDLHFWFEERSGALAGSIIYNPDLFRRDRIERMASHLSTLVAAVIADPDRPIDQLDLIGAAERRRLLVEFNPRPPASGGPCPTLAAWFAATARDAGDRPAVSIDEGARREMTYADLDAAANRVAHALSAKGVGPDVLVGLAADRSIEAIVGLLAIVKAGGAYVPFDPAYPADRVAFIARDAGLAIVVGGRNALERVQDLALDAVAVEDVQSPDGNPGSPMVELRPDHLAYVIYTSGSTGRPKGVMVTHRNVARLFDATRALFRFGAADVWTLFHSIAFDFSVWEIWGALLFGGKLVVVPHWTTRSPQDLAALVERERVTVLNQTPSAFRAFDEAMVARRPAGLSSLRVVIFGGEALDVRSLLPWFDRHGDESPRLINMYGITETTVHVTHRRIRRTDAEAGRSVIGRPIDDLRVHVLNSFGEPVPIGVPGEIWVGGDGVARGYLNRPALTAEGFVPDPFGPGRRLYRSGDLARYLPDGDLEYLGRSDDQVKIRGHRIELGEIQAALEAHVGVRQALAIARPRRSDWSIVAYVAPQPGVSVGALRDHLRDRLPAYMVPEAVVLLDQFPLTPHGKIDRRALPDPEAGRVAAPSTVPESELEQLIGRILRTVLDVPGVDVDENFFDLGAHSLMLVRAHAALQAARDEPIPLVAFYQYPTVRLLAAHLDDRRAAPTPDAGAADDARAARRRASRAPRRDRRAQERP